MEKSEFAMRCAGDHGRAFVATGQGLDEEMITYCTASGDSVGGLGNS
ncbi:MAG: hypothetical protein U0236_07750 [Nitrospira sp.]